MTEDWYNYRSDGEGPCKLELVELVSIAVFVFVVNIVDILSFYF